MGNGRRKDDPDPAKREELMARLTGEIVRAIGRGRADGLTWGDVREVLMSVTRLAK